MSRVREFAIEAGIIGLSSALAGVALNRAGLASGRPSFWFAIGVLTHAGWELTGGNRWYIESRDPESLPKGFLG